jgi:CheY-like chemotaxis protein
MNINTTSEGVQRSTDVGASQPAPEPGGERAASRPARVLLAEDDAAVRRYLEAALRRAGYIVLTAADGLEAMKLALTCEVDAVVTDCLMPHVGGRELCLFLRGHPRLKGLPALLLSGDELPDGAHECADACLRKPVRPEELALCLAGLVSRGT